MHGRGTPALAYAKMMQTAIVFLSLVKWHKSLPVRAHNCNL